MTQVGDNEAKELPGGPNQNTWKNLDSLWNVENPFRQRQLFSSLFRLPDGVATSAAAMQLDYAYYGIRFAHDAGFNRTQMRILYEILEDTLQSLRDDEELVACVQGFKERLLRHAVSGRGGDIVDHDVEEEKRQAAAIAAEAKRLQEEEEAKSQKKGKRSSSKQPPVPPANPEPLEPNPKSDGPLRVFADVHVQAITKYLTETVFHHFELYRAVFGARFQPTQKPITFQLQLQTVVPSFHRLDEAIQAEHSLAALEADSKQSEVKTSTETELDSAMQSGGSAVPEDVAPSETAGETKETAMEDQARESSLTVDASDPKAVHDYLGKLKQDLDMQLQAHQRQIDARLQEFEK